MQDRVRVHSLSIFAMQWDGQSTSFLHAVVCTSSTRIRTRIGSMQRERRLTQARGCAIGGLERVVLWIRLRIDVAFFLAFPPRTDPPCLHHRSTCVLVRLACLPRPRLVPSRALAEGHGAICSVCGGNTNLGTRDQESVGRASTAMAMDAHRRLLTTATRALGTQERLRSTSRAELARARPFLLRSLAPGSDATTATTDGKETAPFAAAARALAASLRTSEAEAASYLRHVQQQADAYASTRGLDLESFFPDAAGAFHAEKLALLQTIRMVLAAQVTRFGGHGEEERPDDYVDRFNAALLTERLHGSGLVARLVAQVRDAPWTVSPGSKLEYARTRSGGSLVSRSVLLQREITLACECIYLACTIQTGMMPLEEVRSISDLAAELCGRCERLADQDDGVHLQHAYVVTLGLVRAFGVVDGEEEEDEETHGHGGEERFSQDRQGNDESRQKKKAWIKEVKERHAHLAADAGLASKMAWKGNNEDGHARTLSGGLLAIATMAWALVLPNSEDDTAMHALENAISAGALATMEAVYRSTTFRDDLPSMQLEYAAAGHKVLSALLSSQRGAQMVSKLRDAGEDVAPALGPGYRALGLMEKVSCTSLGSLLSALAAVYDRDPSLSYMCPPVRDWSFLDYAAEGEPTLGLLVPYLQCVAAISSFGVEAANEVFARLLSPPAGAPNNIRWDILFRSLEAYCQRYASVLSSGRHEKSLAGVMPPEDAAGLSAYLTAIRSCFEAAPELVPGWTRRLLERQKSSPLELLLQIVQFPTPVAIKVEVYELIGAMATSPSACTQVWDALDTFGNLGIGAGRTDLAIRLAEEEAKKESYGETLSFVRLLNRLLSVAPLPDFGRPRAHYFAFVRNVVFAPCLRRGYKNLSERWQVASACLENFEKLLQPAVSSKSVQELDTPASTIMVDFLEEGSVFRALLGILSIGSEQLARARLSSHEGAWMELAVGSALSVLQLALACDGAYSAALRNARGGGAPPTVDRALLRDASCAAALLSYVSYVHNPSLQVKAIKITLQLDFRSDERLLSSLLTETNWDFPTVTGFAAALQAGLDSAITGTQDCLVIAPPATEAGGVPADETSAADERASLLLDLIISSLRSSPSPSFAHYLLGFDVVAAAPGASALALYDPRAFDGCLRPVLLLAESDVALLEAPILHARCLELLYQLCEDSTTRAAMHELLRDRISYFAPHMPVIFRSPLSEENFEYGLQQRSWLLRLAALALHDADESDPVDRTLLVRVLGALFFPPMVEDSVPGSFSPEFEGMRTESDQTRSAADEVLELCCESIPTAPGGLELSATARRAANELGIEQVLNDSSMRIQGESDQIDIQLLGATLQNRAEGLAAQGGAREPLKEAVLGAVRYAAEWNRYALVWGAVRGMAKAWQLSVEIAVSRRYHLFREAAGVAQIDIGSTLDVVLPLLSSTLTVLPGTLQAKDGAALARPFALAVQTLVAQLVLDPDSPGAPAPAASHALLRQLLAAVKASTERRGEATSTPLYGALLAFLQYTRARDESEILLGGVVSLLRGAASWLLPALARDTSEGNLGGSGAAIRSLSRCIMASLVSLDPMLVDGVFHTGAPQAFLADLPRSPASVFSAPAAIAWRASFALEAGLGLLLQLATSRVPHGAKQLAAGGALISLADFRAISSEPEIAPGVPGSQVGRRRRVLGATLRLALAITAALPTSREVTEQAVAFVSAQQRVLIRCLAGRAMGAATLPFHQELELIMLASALVAYVQGKDSLQTPPALRASMYSLAWQFFPREGPATKRMSGAVGQDASMAETLDRLWGVRCNIARFLRGVASTDGDVFPCIRSVSHTEVLDSEGSESRPTMRLMVDLLRTAVDDLFNHAEQRDALAGAINPEDENMGLEIAPEGIEALRMEGVDPQRVTSRDIIAALKHQDRIISRLFFISENVLATLYLNLRRCLQPATKDIFATRDAFSAADDMYTTPIRPSNGGEPSSQAMLGTQLELEQLSKLLLPVLETVSQMRTKDFGRDLQYLHLLVRRTKEYLSL